MENNRNNYNTGRANGAPQDDEYMTMYAGNEPPNGQNGQYDPNAQYQQGYGDATINGTLYFQPDLSSGVQMRLSSKNGYVSGKDGDFYFVMISNGIGGWVNKGQLTFN